MNIDDFPFNDFAEQGRKVRFNILIQKVRALLLSEKEVEWTKVAGASEDKEDWMASRASEDAALIKSIMEIYIEMGCVIEQVVFKTNSLDNNIVRWSINNDIYALDMKRPWNEIMEHQERI